MYFSADLFLMSEAPNLIDFDTFLGNSSLHVIDGHRSDRRRQVLLSFQFILYTVYVFNKISFELPPVIIILFFLLGMVYSWYIFLIYLDKLSILSNLIIFKFIYAF